MAIVSGAGGTFNSNPWTVISNAWNAGALVYGRDYTQQVVYDPANPNEGVSASWSFPGRTGPNLTVLSYPALGYGASPWNATIAGSESKFPIKISDISSLVFNHDVSISGQTDGYNIAYDLWLTSTPGGSGATVTHEIMIWIHTGAGGPAGSVVSSYRDDVFNGSIYTAKMTDAAGSSTHSWQYVAIQAQGDDLVSQVDFGAMLTQLKALGIVTGNEYLADVQLGAEITFGSGAYTINYMDVNLNGAGNYLQKEDDALRGTARTEHLYLYGQNAPQANGALYGNFQASTFDTVVSFTINGTIMGGKAPAVSVLANGSKLGAFTLAPVRSGYTDSYGVTWSVPETFTVRLPGLTKLNELRLVFDGQAEVGGPERMTTFVSGITVNGVPVTTARYFPAVGAAEQQMSTAAGIVQWNGGYTVLDVSGWNNSLANRTIGSDANPILVTGGGGSDVLHVLGSPGQYQVIALGDGGYALKDLAGLGQNAMLKGISAITFQDGSTLTLATPLHGSAAGEVLNGTAQLREIHGGAGNDTITSGGPGSYLRGDEGDDVIVGSAGFDDMHGNAGSDTLNGGAGDDWVVGGRDNDLLGGEAGADVVLGNLGNDTVNGGDGADVVRGGQGDDVVNGGAGDDWLSGDRGNDTITGGAGADRFRGGVDLAIDRILDFNQAEGDRVMIDPGTAYSVAQAGADTVVTLSGGQMVLVGVQLSSLRSGWIFEGV